MLAKGDTKVRGRFCERRCGPSRRGERNASAVLKNFVRLPEKTFSTVSAQTRSAAMSAIAPLLGDKRTWRTRPALVANDQGRHWSARRKQITPAVLRRVIGALFFALSDAGHNCGVPPYLIFYPSFPCQPLLI